MPIDRRRRRTSEPAGGERPPALAGVLLVTLLGVIGMHGLSSHGVHGADAGHSSSTPVAHHWPEMADHDLTVAGPQGGPAERLITASCFAILIGLGFALLALGSSRCDAGRAGRRQTYSAFITRPHNRGPPTLAELSILRC